MFKNYRLLCPVGQGGFDIENIDGTTIVFDCGSKPHINVKNCILHYKDFIEKNNGQTVIDYVFLSHFDRDHVSGLDALSEHFEIKNIIVPYIPRKYRVIYNYVTNFAVTSFYNLLMNSNKYNLTGVNILGSKYTDSQRRLYHSVKSTNNKWEWVYKSVFSCNHWEKLLEKLKEDGYVFNKSSNYSDSFLNEEDYAMNVKEDDWERCIENIKESWRNKKFEENTMDTPKGFCIEDFDINSYKDEIELSKEQMRKINDAIGNIIGGDKSFAKNENGLLMLSKRLVQNVRINIFYPGINCIFQNFHYPFFHNWSACIYSGDMKFDVKTCPTILDFLKMSNEPLLLFQIPHHGSPHNSSSNYLQLLPSNLFFWHDKNFARLRKNTNVVNNIQPSCRLILIDTVFYFFCDIII